MTTIPSNTTFLRRALQANAVFSGLSGLTLIVASGPIGTLIGLSVSSILIGIGISLLVYAAGLFRNAARDTINRTEAYLSVIMDTAWVAGSAVIIFLGILSTTGNWIVAGVADIVLVFGALQYYGLRKMSRE